MKKLNLKKKDFAYLSVILVLVIAIVVLSIGLYTANMRKASWEMSEYYNNKVTSFGIQNANLSKGQIVFVGDSITDLYVLDEHYGSLQRACYNRGIGGDTTSGVLERLQVSVFDLAPSTVVLMIGTNDVNGGLPEDEILGRYRQIVETITATLPNAQLYCVSIIPQNKQLETYSNIKVDHTTQVILRLNAQIRQLAGSNGAVYIDLFPLLADGDNFLLPQYNDDGLHLNPTGLAVWTSQLLPLLAQQTD